MMRTIIFISLCIFLNSCISEIDRYLDAKHVELKKIRSYPEGSGLSSSWSIYGNDCRLELNIRNLNLTGIVSDSSVIPEYRLKAVIFDGSGTLKLSPGFSSYYTRKDLIKGNNIVFEKVLDYAGTNASAAFDFPMYLFHNLKAGKNKLYMGVVVTRNAGTGEEQLFKGFYSFNLDVPEIYQSRLICNGLELQNDSIWSPYNSDFSFGKGLPDVYWAICLPSKDSNDVSNYYASTPVIWNQYGYYNTDTIDIFTYDKDEGLLIGVYDYDRVWSDEYIGSWQGRLSDLNSKAPDSLRFTHVSSFRYEFSSPRVFNSAKK